MQVSELIKEIPPNEYLNFRYSGTTESGKTAIVTIDSIAGYELGKIKWYGAWRQYVFEPSPRTVFNTDCMNTIILCIEMMNENHKRKE